MLSLKIEYEVPEDRHLNIQLPPEVNPGKHEIILVVDNVEESVEISTSEQLPDLIGSLKTSKVKKAPAELLMESGFIGCGEADPLLSENYKSRLTEILREKHDNR